MKGMMIETYLLVSSLNFETFCLSEFQRVLIVSPQSRRHPTKKKQRNSVRDIKLFEERRREELRDSPWNWEDLENRSTEESRDRGIVACFHRWWVWIIPLSRRRQERRRTMGGGGSVVEDPCGGSVWRISGGFRRFDRFRPSPCCREHRENKETKWEKKRKKEKKKKTLIGRQTRGFTTSHIFDHKTLLLRTSNPYFLFFWFNFNPLNT